MATSNDSFSSSAAHAAGVPDTSMLPPPAKAPLAAVDMMQRVVQGAHTTIDHLADSAAPQVQRLAEGLSDAGDALQARAEQLRGKSDALADSLRGTVRANPLTAVVSALLIGAVLARIVRR